MAHVVRVALAALLCLKPLNSNMAMFLRKAITCGPDPFLIRLASED